MQVALSPPYVLLVVLIGGTALITSDAMAPADLLPFLLLGLGLTAPVAALGHGFDDMQAAGRAVGRIRDILVETPLPEPSQPIAPRGHRVELRDIRFGYDTGDEVLRGIDLVLKPGTVTARTARTPTPASTATSSNGPRTSSAPTKSDLVLAPFDGEMPTEVREALLEQARTPAQGPRKNRYHLQGAISFDPRIAMVRSLELFNDENGTAAKTSIFTGDATLTARVSDSASNIDEAIAISVDQLGRVDPARMAQLLDSDPAPSTAN